MTLGWEAGAAMARLFLEWGTALKRTPVYDRIAVTSPLLEIAKYLLHKLGGILAMLRLMQLMERRSMVANLNRSTTRMDKAMTSFARVMKSPFP